MTEFSGTERFQVLRQLGMGGMGVVYEAYDRERGERVAVKTLRDLAGSAILHLKTEFRALGDLHHPNLVRLGELFESSGQWFFTMELVHGTDLLSWVREDHARLRDALGQLVAGLGALHDAGRVHRDVKPSNVLVSAGRVVLLDFGLTTRVAGESLSWTDASMVGTPDYMAPEQAASQPVGAEADWYSVGVILFEALTGRPPIDGRPLEVLMNKQRTVPPLASTLATVPPDLDALAADLLAVDPAHRPGRREILRRLGGTRAAAAGTPPTQRQAFVGRSAELAELASALDAVGTGEQVSVLVEGESGMGKSALAQQFVDGLDRSEVVVLRGRCYERESVPYKAVDGVIDALSRWLARQHESEAEAVSPLGVALLAEVFPVLRGVKSIALARRRATIPDPHEQRRRVFGSLRELLARLAERRRLVLVIDDLHWADQDSLALLDAVLRPPDAPRLLLLATAQPRGADDPLTRLPLHRITLGPLPPDDAARLTESLLTAARAPATPAIVESIVRESGGLPLFVAELVRHTALRGDAGADVRLDDVLGARIAALEPAERELLELAAIAGRPLPLETAARALDLEPAALAPLLGYLQSANLARATGRSRKDTVEAAHDRIRKAAVAGIGDRRAAMHGRLAVALEASTNDEHPMVLATHWERAGDTSRAAGHYERAADRAAAALAFDRAVRLYERSLTLQSESSHSLRVKLADALGNAGRGRESADHYLAAATSADTAADTLELERRAAAQLLRSGHVDDGLAVLERVLGQVGMSLPHTPRRALASLLWDRAHLAVRGTGFQPRDPSEVSRADLERIDTCWAAAIGLSLTDYIRGAAFQTRSLLLSLRAGETFRAHRSILLEAAHGAALGGRKRAARARRLLDGVDTDRDPYLRGLGLGCRSFEAYASGRWRDAFELAEASDAELAERCTGAVWERDTAHTLSHWAQVYLGSLGSLGQMLPERLRQAELQGNRFAVGTLPSSVSIAHWLARDDADGARHLLDAIAQRLTPHGFQVQHWNEMVARTLIDLYRGDAAAAHERIEATWRPLSGSLLMRVQIIRVEIAELRARAAIGVAAAAPASERARLLDLADQLARRMTREDLAWPAGVSALLRGQVAALRGDRERAAALLGDAVAGCDASETRLYGAGARACLAELIGGDRGAALRGEALEFLAAQGVIAPDRMLALYAPSLAPGT